MSVSVLFVVRCLPFRFGFRRTDQVIVNKTQHGRNDRRVHHIHKRLHIGQRIERVDRLTEQVIIKTASANDGAWNHNPAARKVAMSFDHLPFRTIWRSAVDAGSWDSARREA